jgi:hypothetical protein
LVQTVFSQFQIWSRLGPDLVQIDVQAVQIPKSGRYVRTCCPHFGLVQTAFSHRLGGCQNWSRRFFPNSRFGPDLVQTWSRSMYRLSRFQNLDGMSGHAVQILDWSRPHFHIDSVPIFLMTLPPRIAAAPPSSSHKPDPTQSSCPFFCRIMPKGRSRGVAKEHAGGRRVVGKVVELKRQKLRDRRMRRWPQLNRGTQQPTKIRCRPWEGHGGGARLWRNVGGEGFATIWRRQMRR